MLFHKKNKSVLPEDIEFPFDKLDASSTKLRSTAKELAVLLSSGKSKSPELKAVISSLENISKGKIHTMDEALLNFKAALEKLPRANKKKHAFSSSFSDEKLTPILKKYTDFIQEMVKLSEKANTLTP
jgi:hypothetical protein